MQIIDSITEYIDELAITNTSKETIRAYKNSLNIFSKFIKEDTDVKKISSSDIKSFQQFNKDRGLKQNTLNNLSKNEISFEDLAPLMYIQTKIFGIKEK